MKVLEAIEFFRPIDKGGSTYPWVVLVEEQGKIVPYVVKLFKTKQVNQQCAVAKEAFGNILALEFDLPVPAFTFINFSEAFIETLPEEFKKKLERLDNRIKFGSRLMDDFLIFDADNYSRNTNDYETMASIFAFDNLVWNLDRGGERNKPNLLMRDGEFLLIDHEQILFFIDDEEQGNRKILDDFIKGRWTYPYKNHLFYNILKNTSKKFKTNWLDTFEEYLRLLRPEILDSCANFLQSNGHPIGDFALLKEYLYAIKGNSSEFLKNVNAQ